LIIDRRRKVTTNLDEKGVPIELVAIFGHGFTIKEKFADCNGEMKR